ncbi:hypothetical protein K474DRAFT_1711068 [Panus rudis PR-1116 ss-1]|nr:hypothetical protein K474DRAFT_1711068 [Panus rudis PR-1116 ss-1]
MDKGANDNEAVAASTDSEDDREDAVSFGSLEEDSVLDTPSKSNLIPHPGGDPNLNNTLREATPLPQEPSTPPTRSVTDSFRRRNQRSGREPVDTTPTYPAAGAKFSLPPHEVAT